MAKKINELLQGVFLEKLTDKEFDQLVVIVNKLVRKKAKQLLKEVKKEFFQEEEERLMKKVEKIEKVYQQRIAKLKKLIACNKKMLHKNSLRMELLERKIRFENNLYLDQMYELFSEKRPTRDGQAFVPGVRVKKV